MNKVKEKNKKPPRLAGWLISRMTAYQHEYSAAGDIEEVFYRIYAESGYRKAAFWYRCQCFLSLLKYSLFNLNWSFVMFKNYFKTAVRNLVRHKGYSFINVTGLSIALACAFLIILYISNELSFDRFHDKAQRIYRISPTYYTPEGSEEYTRISPMAVPSLVKDFPEIETGVRFLRLSNQTIKYKNRLFNEEFFAFADESVFNIFTFPLIAGNPDEALKEPNTIVISESAAEKYFGNENPIGKTVFINFNGQTALKVTGIMKNMPYNSHFRFETLASMKTYENKNGQFFNTWGMNIFYSYVLLKKETSFDKLYAKIPDFTNKYLGKDWQPGFRTDYDFIPLADIHLRSHRKMEFQTNGNILHVYGFILIAFFILVLAGVNFINLGTARSNTRMKEVSIRKALGGYKRQLIKQFLGESVFLSTVSFLFSIGIVITVLPVFNDFFNIRLSIFSNNSFITIFYFFLLSLLLGLSAGIYPAFYLSSFLPTESLKKELKTSFRAIFVRKILVVFQFVISITLIIATIITGNQIKYLKNRNLGFNKENIIIMDYPGLNEYKTLKSALLDNPAVINITASGDIIGRMYTYLSAKTDFINEPKRTIALIVDIDFLKTYGMKIIAGRDFRESDTGKWNDSGWQKGMIINEKAVKELGFNSPEEAIGKKIHMNSKSVIAGVVEDFNYYSLHRQSGTLVMAVWPGWFGHVSIKVKGDDFNNTIGSIRDIWKKIVPDEPFEYRFFDDTFNSLYKSDEIFSSLFYFFSFLAVFIACIGLFAVSSYSVARRTKELGIRKVLGASNISLVKLVLTEFLTLVLAANIFAWPIGYIIMKIWIHRNFAFYKNFDWSSFAIAGLITLIIALLTVIFNSVKAASANPVESLRSE